MIYGHGDDIHGHSRPIRYNFSSNVRQGVDHSGLMLHLWEDLTLLSNYPEPAPVSLEEKISEALGVKSNCVMVTNGATEAIYLAATLKIDARSAVLTPTFAEYADAAAAAGHEVRNMPSILSLSKDYDMAWICNPNNPTGRMIPAQEILEIADALPYTMMVVDQAYHRYTPFPAIEPHEAVLRNNVLLIYSMTKDYSVPGLRIGYAVGNPHIIARMRSGRMPWAMSTPALKAAHYLLDHEADYAMPLEDMLAQAQRLRQGLEEIGIKVEPSTTPFMLCELPDLADAYSLKQYLIDKADILIRAAGNMRPLDRPYFRVASIGAEADALLVKKIKEWMQYGR
ncbi:MAG: aminotransferase class I/II-fold pyridoxal phosphate-dependent enzyme [Bacteroidales bacterium]|nr:aminotransferase class I/II-fold pyridoxal phosphate-dependent enzyme [Bacteroidales bacterium]